MTETDALAPGLAKVSDKQFFVAIDRETGNPCNIVEAEAVNSAWGRRYRFVAWADILSALEGKGE